MKFQGTKVSLGLVLSGALLLGACTSPEPTEPEVTRALNDRLQYGEGLKPAAILD